MQTTRFVGVANILQRIVIWLLALVTCASPLVQGQDTRYPPQKSLPSKIESQIVVLPESVVQVQWKNTLKLVNAPQNISLLNPGQCVRVAIYSTGDKRDDFLEKTRLSYRVHFAGHNDSVTLASLSEFKQIKPEGGDFVNAALNSAGIEQPAVTKTMASLGVAADHWCVPIDAVDGIATVEAEVESPSGHKSLKASTIRVESFETGGKKSFKDIDELGAFLEAYYRQPNPARLLPALQFVVANQTQQSSGGQAEIYAAFLSAALKSDAIAAQNFRSRIGAQPPLTRAFGLLALRSAGYDVSSVLDAMSVDEQQKFRRLPPLQDPFDLTPTESLFQHLDMLWAVFGATGQFQPVKTISSALSWKADYEDFKRQRKTLNSQPTVTPSVVRGIVYTAAGWSLRSYQRNDPLVADYIDFLRTSPETSQSVKAELAELASNPAFTRHGGP